jgi:hypothetical protein
VRSAGCSKTWATGYGEFDPVRQLDALDTFMNTVSQVKISFGDFGLPVSVSAPPASETYIPGPVT